MRGLFVTATDTGVGKTEVACALLANARAAGLDAVGMKPAQSGVAPGEPTDAERLRAASDRSSRSRRLPVLVRGAARAGGGGAARGAEVSFGADLEAARARRAPRRGRRRGRGRAPRAAHRARDLRRPRGARWALPVVVAARRARHGEPHRAHRRGAARARPRDRRRRAEPHRATDDPSVPYNAAEIARLTGSSGRHAAVRARYRSAGDAAIQARRKDPVLGAASEKWIDRRIDPRDRGVPNVVDLTPVPPRARRILQRILEERGPGFGFLPRVPVASSRSSIPPRPHRAGWSRRAPQSGARARAQRPERRCR